MAPIVNPLKGNPVNRSTPIDATVTTPESDLTADLANRPIRELVAAYPATLGVLAPLGIDLCCGGGHPLGDALALHGIDPAAPLAAIAEIVARRDAPAR
jgi:hypothetical protein